MIEALSSKRMITIVVILIVICTIIVIIEEWFTNSQIVISSLPNDILNQRGSFSFNQSINTNNNNNNNIVDVNQQLQKPPHHLLDRIATNLQEQISRKLRVSTEKCWLDESVEIIQPCALCKTYELETSHSRYRTNVHLCSTTGYKELIECSRSGLVERACYTNWRKFLTFLALVSIIGSLSGLLTRYRQLQLRCRLMYKFRKEEAEQLDESSHTLIDMDSLT